MHVEYKPHCLNKFMAPYSIMSQSRYKDFYNDWAQLHNIYIYISIYVWAYNMGQNL